MNNDYPIYFEGLPQTATQTPVVPVATAAAGHHVPSSHKRHGEDNSRYMYEKYEPSHPLGYPQFDMTQQQSMLFDPSCNGQTLQDLYQDKQGLFDYPKPPSPPPVRPMSPPKLVKRRRCRPLEDSRTVNNWEDLSLKEGYKSFLSTAMKLNITTGVAWTSLDAALLDIWCFNQFVLKKWVEYRNKGTANGINYLCRHCKGYRIRIHMVSWVTRFV